MKLNTPNREPAIEEARTVVKFGIDSWMATWYPQMGGYVGKCWVRVSGGPNSCFEALVYHDGEFPFTEDKGPPTRIHHCMVGQFRTFADDVEQAQSKFENPNE